MAKCRVIAPNFFTVTSSQVSHIDAIVMNPPFSQDEKHILHAYNIAPPGCRITALCNLNTLENKYSSRRRELANIIEEHGYYENLGNCFSTAERKTDVEVALVKITKPGTATKDEFEGFFMEDDPEEAQGNGIISYNVVRDLVNRYVAAVKLFDQQLSIGMKMDALLSGYYGEVLAFICTENGQPKLRNDFKKGLQKAGWEFIFKKMNMDKYATKGLKEDINKFVEQQQNIPFTMRNIYRMLDIVVGTQSQRMDKALLEVFEKLTEHHHDNRYNIEGWKTNSHFLVNRKFILPHICWQDQRWHKGESKIRMGYGENVDFIEDLMKALCYLTGDRYEEFGRLSYNISRCEHNYGEWFEWGYFRVKAFKKGSMHFEFKDEDLWGKFNQRIAKLKGYPLFEGKAQTAYQDRNTGRKKKNAA
jgi:hypothetical protein